VHTMSFVQKRTPLRDGMLLAWSRGPEWIGLPALTGSAVPVTEYLVSQGFVSREDGMLFIGPEAEAKFGRRHFMELMATFTAPPEFTVFHGRAEIGRTDPVLLTDRAHVEPADGGGRARWLSSVLGGVTYDVARSMRDVLLGAATQAARLADLDHAADLLAEQVRFER
jgi:ATP-dependent Lhr-like helicase